MTSTAASALLCLYTETPCHAGGAESTGAIDLPIQRAVTTGVPVIWGSSLKGALKDHARSVWQNDSARVHRVFGSDPVTSSANGAEPAASAEAGEDRTRRTPTPGWVAVTEARVAAFPVPTLQNVFAWVTSPMALAGVARYASLAGIDTPPVPRVTGAAAVPASSGRRNGSLGVGSFVLSAAGDTGPHEVAGRWAAWLAERAMPGEQALGPFKERMQQDLLVVSDDVYVELTREFSPVAPRVKLREDTKTVENFFYEESLPPDTLLIALLSAASGGWSLDDLTPLVGNDTVFTVGGSETVGAGFVWSRLATGDNSEGA